MRILPIDRCTSGMVLAKNIYNDDGRILLARNVTLTDSLIRRLAVLGISRVFIRDERLDDVEPSAAISEQTRIKAVAMMRELMTEEIFSTQNRIQIKRLRDKAESLFWDVYREVSHHETTLIMLNDVYTKDAYTYTHSFHVGVYAIALGVQLGLAKEDLFQLGIGTFLHDIGKLKIPAEILNKPGRLTAEEFAEMRRHTIYGYDALRDVFDVPLLSAHVALQHHERLDGSGYPRGLKRSEIHPFGKLVAIADVYDALVSQRVYKEAYLPHVAMEVLYSGSGTQFDTDYLTSFRRTVALYPVGATLILDGGAEAVVVDNNVALPERPVVRVLFDDVSGKATPYEIDLSKELQRQIVRVEN